MAEADGNATHQGNVVRQPSRSRTMFVWGDRHTPSPPCGSRVFYGSVTQRPLQRERQGTLSVGARLRRRISSAALRRPCSACGDRLASCIVGCRWPGRRLVETWLCTVGSTHEHDAVIGGSCSGAGGLASQRAVRIDVVACQLRPERISRRGRFAVPSGGVD
eukprot:359188-Chlamydomonas_euryale.AAC.9